MFKTVVKIHEEEVWGKQISGAIVVMILGRRIVGLRCKVVAFDGTLLAQAV